ncbi:MAG: hypothetical protein HKP58_02815 [Desulfatitalea sp.]|nr:hypothetical protein [Desulfatitalea sp.]NNJ99323.1 hypothetical protein [Desulfatitalea sp.]
MQATAVVTKAKMDTLQKIHIWAARSGWIFTAGFLFAVLPWFGGGIPPMLKPTDTPEAVWAFYSGQKYWVLAGAWIGMSASAFYYVWGGAIAAMLRRTEYGRPPILTYTQLGAVGVAVFNSVLYFFVMAWVGFRVETMDPKMIQHLNDFLFIQLEFEVFPLSLWAVAMGLSILLDKSKDPVMPRWVAWANFWYAGLVMSGQFMIFFKSGPAAWNGVLAVYWPAFVFFTWLCIMSSQMVKAIKKYDYAAGEARANLEVYT